MRQTRTPTEPRHSPLRRATTTTLVLVAVFVALVAATAPMTTGAVLGAGILVAGTSRVVTALNKNGAVTICIPRTDVCMRASVVQS